MFSSLLCVAFAIYFEARSEPPIGQLAVAKVIENRVAHPDFPDTACEVVKQPKHFEFYWDGKSEEIKNKQAFGRALGIALIAPSMPDPTNGAVFYHRTSLPEGKVIGGHIFYHEY